MTKAREHDPRLDLLNTLLTTPHRQLTPLWPVHRDLCGRDPRFYVRLAAWYADRGEVRDHKEMFVVTLALSDFEGHRDVGLALLSRLPPFQVGRVVDFISGRKVKGKDGKVEEVGLFRSLPRSLKTEVARYLREREANDERFDRAVLTARRAIKRLYALLHVKPAARAQQVLFDDNPPPGSRAFALKQLARASDPAEQARVIVEHRVPYRVASAAVRAMTPEVVRALVEVMTPQEVINSVGALRQRGALADAAVAELVERRLDEAKRDSRVSAFKAQVAVAEADVGGELAESLRAVTDARVKARGRIGRPTALLLDRSPSMSVALEVGKQLGALISAVCTEALYCYAFDQGAMPIRPAGKELSDWQRALAQVGIGSGTSIGAAVAALTRAKQYVEQLVFVTDQEENTAPMFADAYQAYVKAMGVRPDVVIIKVGSMSDLVEQACKRLGVPCQTFPFQGDYYALPNVLPLLSQGSQTELLLEILDYPLPARKKG